jgi:hypothetical protein
MMSNRPENFIAKGADTALRLARWPILIGARLLGSSLSPQYLPDSRCCTDPLYFRPGNCDSSAGKVIGNRPEG